MVWPGQREILFGESGVQARKNKTPPFGGASGSKFNAKFFSHFFWSHVGRSFFDNLFHLSGAKKFLLLCFKSCNLCVDFCNFVFHSATSAFCFFFSHNTLPPIDLVITFIPYFDTECNIQ
nr:MAG TPA: hypothetical protein [Caudoviricetes sp.]